jgi:hypothetical protein
MSKSFYRWERLNQIPENPGVANEKIAAFGSLPVGAAEGCDLLIFYT